MVWNTRDRLEQFFIHIWWLIFHQYVEGHRVKPKVLLLKPRKKTKQKNNSKTKVVLRVINLTVQRITEKSNLKWHIKKKYINQPPHTDNHSSVYSPFPLELQSRQKKQSPSHHIKHCKQRDKNSKNISYNETIVL